MPNSEAMIIKYLHDKGAAEGVPISGTFELTQRCNFNCEMCYVHDANKKKDALTAKDWLDLGREAQKAGTVFLLLTGGEPLIREDFEEIYVGLIKMGFLISINTNGSLVDRHIELFKKYHPTKLNISLYGADNKAYRSLCHVNSFEKVTSNIKLLRENGIEVRINHIVTKDNADDHKRIYDLSKQLDAKIKSTAYTYPAIRLGKVDNEARLSPQLAGDYMIEIDRYQFPPNKFSSMMKNISSLPKQSRDDKIQCRAGSCTFWITADGIMRPCGMMPEPDAYPLKDGFMTAWEQTKKATAAIRLPKECMNCKYSSFCIVCAAMCKAETGSFDKKPEYLCQMMQEIYERSLKEIEVEHK